VIAVLLNGVVALAWGLWREKSILQKQADEIAELQTQLKNRTEGPARDLTKSSQPAGAAPSSNIYGN